MTTNYHTVIATGAAANASVFNAPLGQLDAILGDAMSYGINNNAELVAARSPYASLDARLDALVMAGGNVATKANGVSAAGQKVLTVDSTTDFVVGAYVTYLLNGATLEGNTIASIQAGVSLTLGTNIGASPAGGVLDDSYISMISISEYLAAQAIPHAGTLMLPNTVEYVNKNTYNVDAFGADNTGASYCHAALQAAFDAVHAMGGGAVEFTAGRTYKLDAQLEGVSIYSNTKIVGNGAKIHIANLTAGRTDGNECAFYIPDNESNIEISGFEFYGDAADAVVHDEGQSAAIWMPGVGGAPYTQNVNIHHNYFHNLYGFTVHLAGYGLRVDVCDNLMVHCANGLNVNAAYSQQSRNHLLNCDAIEASGDFTVIADNIIEGCVSGISIGGHTSPGSHSMGTVCRGNRITDSTGAFSAITISDACEDTQIIENYIARIEVQGIVVTSSGYNDIKNVLIANNTVRSTKSHGIYVAGTAVKGTVIRGNYVYNQADDTGYAMGFGILMDQVDRANVSDNTVYGATNTDIMITRCTLLSMGRNTAAVVELLNVSYPNTYLTPASFQRVGVPGAYTIHGHEDLIECYGYTATHAITLPAVATMPKYKRITIKDYHGVSGSYTITITPDGSETIDGAPNKMITTNWGSLTIYADAYGWYTV